MSVRTDLPDEVWDAAVAHRDQRLRSSLAESAAAPAAQRGRLVSDPERIVRLVLAHGPDLFRVKPDPLPDEAYDRLAADDDSDVRFELAAAWHCPEWIRRRLVTDADPAVRRAAYGNWRNPPEEITDRLLADPDHAVRHAVARHACRHRPELLSAVLDEVTDPWPLRELALRAPLNREQCLPLVRHEDAGVRAAVAENPYLPADLVGEMATDQEPRVRLRLSMRSGLSEAERAAIDYEVAPGDRIEPAQWVLDRLDDPDVLQQCVHSAHLGLRRSAAYSPYLTPQQVEVLAGDHDFAVRLLLCENHDDVPAELLLATYLEAQVITAGALLSRPNFPRAGLARLADAAEPKARALSVLDPATPDAVIERLSRDDEPQVRSAAAADPRLSPARVAELVVESATAYAAARNPGLPVELMKRIVAEAESRAES
ncbi:hypothetical protein [Micromonospora avicenniae]|uniref:hypothetical protein n=1 Tax=Micromonospora avicenniae TaxID=1198245 RepID=UPI00331F5DBC